MKGETTVLYIFYILVYFFFSKMSFKLSPK